jgi:hypothetical protein
VIRLWFSLDDHSPASDNDKNFVARLQAQRFATSRGITLWFLAERIAVIALHYGTK